MSTVSASVKRLIPLFDRILVQRASAAEKTKGGIYIPEGARETLHEGTVIAVGSGARNTKSTTPAHLTPILAVGDKVLLPPFGGSAVKMGGQEAGALVQPCALCFPLCVIMVAIININHLYSTHHYTPSTINNNETGMSDPVSGEEGRLVWSSILQLMPFPTRASTTVPTPTTSATTTVENASTAPAQQEHQHRIVLTLDNAPSIIPLDPRFTSHGFALSTIKLLLSKLHLLFVAAPSSHHVPPSVSPAIVSTVVATEPVLAAGKEDESPPNHSNSANQQARECLHFAAIWAKNAAASDWSSPNAESLLLEACMLLHRAAHLSNEHELFLVTLLNLFPLWMKAIALPVKHDDTTAAKSSATCLTRLHPLLYSTCLRCQNSSAAIPHLPTAWQHFEARLSCRDYRLAHYYAGMIFTRLGKYRQAMLSYRACIATPNERERACSAIQIEAHRKWILVSLLCQGHLSPLPSYTDPAVMTILNCSLNSVRSDRTLYSQLASMWSTRTPTGLLCMLDFVQAHAHTFALHQNAQLVERVVGREWWRWRIHHLAKLYSRLSLQDLFTALAQVAGDDSYQDAQAAAIAFERTWKDMGMSNLAEMCAAWIADGSLDATLTPDGILCFEDPLAMPILDHGLDGYRQEVIKRQQDLLRVKDAVVLAEAIPGPRLLSAGVGEESFFD